MPHMAHNRLALHAGSIYSGTLHRTSLGPSPIFQFQSAMYSVGPGMGVACGAAPDQPEQMLDPARRVSLWALSVLDLVPTPSWSKTALHITLTPAGPALHMASALGRLERLLHEVYLVW